MADEISLFISIVNLLILIFLAGATIWYAHSTNKLVKQPINRQIINKIYAPLNTIMISVQKKNINVYEKANLTPVRNIRENIFYYLVDKSVSKTIEEWQDQGEKYNEIRASLIEEVQRIVNDEINNRMKLIDVDRPESFKSEMVGQLCNFWQSYFPSLIQGRISDEEYEFIENLKGSNDPNKVKFATGFPKAVHGRIDKGLVGNLNKTIQDTETSFSKLKEVLGKELGKIK